MTTKRCEANPNYYSLSFRLQKRRIEQKNREKRVSVLMIRTFFVVTQATDINANTFENKNKEQNINLFLSSKLKFYVI